MKIWVCIESNSKMVNKLIIDYSGLIVQILLFLSSARPTVFMSFVNTEKFVFSYRNKKFWNSKSLILIVRRMSLFVPMKYPVVVWINFNRDQTIFICVHKYLEATCVVNGAIFCCVVRDKEDKKGSAFLICSSSYLVGKFFVFVCFFSFNLFTYISIHHKSSQQPGIASTQSKSKCT